MAAGVALIAVSIAYGAEHPSSGGLAVAIEGGARATNGQMTPRGKGRGLPVIGGDVARSRMDPRFGRIASAIAGKRVEVRCWSRLDWGRLTRQEHVYTRGEIGSETLGFAAIGGDQVNLGPGVCEGLVGLAYRDERPKDEARQLALVSAVVTLGHESQHSKGIAQEAVAECNAAQVAQRTAGELGASRTYAASLVRTYWRHYGEELSAYRSPDCRRGGALDLGYADSIWP
jgi:hypothetical protein